MRDPEELTRPDLQAILVGPDFLAQDLRMSEDFASFNDTDTLRAEVKRRLEIMQQRKAARGDR